MSDNNQKKNSTTDKIIRGAVAVVLIGLIASVIIIAIINKYSLK